MVWCLNDSVSLLTFYGPCQQWMDPSIHLSIYSIHPFIIDTTFFVPEPKMNDISNQVSASSTSSTNAPMYYPPKHSPPTKPDDASTALPYKKPSRKQVNFDKAYWSPLPRNDYDVFLIGPWEAAVLPVMRNRMMCHSLHNDWRKWKLICLPKDPML